jgi:hypothetical protein
MSDDYKQDYEEFWKAIVENPDGTLDKDKVMRELHDYRFMLHEVPKVYCHITGNRISKPNTFAHEVTAAADDVAQEDADIHALEELVDLLTEAVLTDPRAIESLFTTRAVCSHDFVTHPSIVTKIENYGSEAAKATVGILGLLNGWSTPLGYRIEAMYSGVEMKTLIGFRLMPVVGKEKGQP